VVWIDGKRVAGDVGVGILDGVELVPRVILAGIGPLGTGILDAGGVGFSSAFWGSGLGSLGAGFLSGPGFEAPFLGGIFSEGVASRDVMRFV